MRDTREPRRAAHRRDLPLLRRHGRQGRRAAWCRSEPGFLNYVDARAARRGRADRAVELPADVHELEDGAGAGGRQQRGDEAGRADAAQRAAHRRADGARSASRPAWSTSCPGYGARRRPVPGRASAASTRSRSPDRRPSGRKIVAGVGRQLKRVQLELGGKGANIVFDDADLDGGGERHRRSRSSTTRGRPASPARGCCCTRRSPTRSSSASSRWRASIRLGNPLDPATEMGPLTSSGSIATACSATVEVARGAGRRNPARAARRPPMPALAERLLRRADRRARAKPKRSRLPGGGVRPVRHASRTFKRRGRGASRSPTAPTTASAAGCGRATCSARIASPRQMQHRHGLDQLLQARQSGLAVRRRRRSRVTAARWASKRCDEYTEAEVGVGQRGREAAAVLSALTRRRHGDDNGPDSRSARRDP